MARNNIGNLIQGLLQNTNALRGKTFGNEKTMWEISGGGYEDSRGRSRSSGMYLKTGDVDLGSNVSKDLRAKVTTKSSEFVRYQGEVVYSFNRLTNEVTKYEPGAWEDPIRAMYPHQSVEEEKASIQEVCEPRMVNNLQESQPVYASIQLCLL